MPKDAYTNWLGLPPGPRPPTAYELLGLMPGVRDRAAVDRAAAKRMDRLDQFALSSDPKVREEVQQLMNEVARARTQVTEALSASSEQSPSTPPPPVESKRPSRSKITQPTRPSNSSTRRRGRPVNLERSAAAAPRSFAAVWVILFTGWAVSLVLTVLITSIVVTSGKTNPKAQTSRDSASPDNPVGLQAADDRPESTPDRPVPESDPESNPETSARVAALQAYIARRDRLDAEAQIELIRQTLSEYNGGIEVRVSGRVNTEGELYNIAIGNEIANRRPYPGEMITDLTPLTGLQLTHLTLVRCRKIDGLDALRGMPLERIVLAECDNLADLSALEGMPLSDVFITGVSATDFSPLRGSPIRYLTLSDCDGLDSLEVLRGLPLRNLHVTGCPSITDLSPLIGMDLYKVCLSNTNVADLTPLRGMPVIELYLQNCPLLMSLDGLEGMSISVMNFLGSENLVDISALSEVENDRSLNLVRTGVTDLTPLAGMETHVLVLDQCESLESLAGIEQMPRLRTLWLKLTSVPSEEIDRIEGLLPELSVVR